MKSLRKHIVQFTSLLYVLAIIAIILLANHGDLPEWITWYNEIPYGDTIGHFILLGVFPMAITVGFRFKKITVFSRKLFLGTVITCLFVTAEEFSQQFIPARNFSLLDLFASYLGILIFGQLLCSHLRPGSQDDSQVR